ncbi:putative transcription factor C3H family [Helianthus annuus]|nr:putative transcription factor C3H family [Helianthus annuus]
MFPKRPRFSEPSPNHKTELCSQFQRGSCGYGDRCCFAHDIQELKGFQKPRQVIVVDENKKVLSNSNPRLCWRFMNGEKCQYGDKCHFIHVRDEGTNVLLWRTKLCKRWMENGRCKYGGIVALLMGNQVCCLDVCLFFFKLLFIYLFIYLFFFGGGGGGYCK